MRRRVYHGKRLFSLYVINQLIGKALEEAADADAVKAARRFSFGYREAIYRAGALSRRALQLIDVFPVLALTIYAKNSRCAHEECTDWERLKKLAADFAARRQSAVDLVERGARLRDVAAVMHVPMALRCIKPGAAHLVSNVFCQHQELLDSMPTALPRSRIWLQVVDWAHRRGGADFARWTARHSPEIPGNLYEVGSLLSDLADWVSAAWPSKSAEAGRQFVVRPFVPTMSLKTVTTLSADWHEAVASHMDGPQFAFPPPWYSAAKCGAYEILPIDNSAELYREGATMHHCVGGYDDDVKCGDLRLFHSPRRQAGGDTGTGPRRSRGFADTTPWPVQRPAAERNCRHSTAMVAGAKTAAPA